MQRLSDGRIRRTESEWRALVEKFEAGGQSEAAFCRAKKLSRKSFRGWRARLAKAAASPRRVRATRKPKSLAAGFVELTSPPMDAKAGANAEFELELPGGVRLRWRA